MKLIINNLFNKTTVVFIPGLRKKYTDFDITDNGKIINVAATMAKTCNTIIIALDDDDYKKSVPDVAKEMYNKIVSNDITKTKMIIVTHSYGFFYAVQLAEIDGSMFNKLLLIDPPAKTDRLLSRLKNDAMFTVENSTEYIMVKNFDLLPTGQNLKSKIIARVHLNINTSLPKEMMEKIAYFNRLANKNVKSRLIVHSDVSHMIHYQIPDVIVDSIKDLTKC